MVRVTVGAVVGGGNTTLAVEAVASLPTHGGAGPSLRPGESLADLTRRAARGHLASVLASVTSALSEAPDAASSLAALRRLDRLAVDDAAAIASSGVGRAPAALKSLRTPPWPHWRAGLCRRRRGASRAALPPDATPKLVALGLPQDVAAAVAAAARNKPAAEVRALIADLKRNDALRGRVATGALSPSLVEMGADDRCREDRKRKAPPPVVEEEILAEGYVCETWARRA